MTTRKTARLLLFIACVLAFLCSCTFVSSPEELGTLEVVVLDTGKSDAIVLMTDAHTVLIDAGYDENGAEIVDYLKGRGITEIDVFILTHFDKDHVGGADTVLRELTVHRVVQPSYEKDSEQYREYTAALQEMNITPTTLQRSEQITLDGAVFRIYPPQADYDDENNNSLVTSVRFGETSFLFVGDAMSDRLQEVLRLGNSKHTFLKVPHHGNYNKSSSAFFAAVAPECAVIPCSHKEPADDETIAALQAVGANVYLTSDGTVSCISDGKYLYVEQTAPPE